MDRLESNQLDKLVSKTQDFRGRRIVNAGPSQAPNDYTIRGEIGGLVDSAQTVKGILHSAVHFFKNLVSLTGKSYTINRPLRLNSSNNVVTEKLSLSSGDDISGNLGVPSGGTGLATIPVDTIPRGDDTNPVIADTDLTFDKRTLNIINSTGEGDGNTRLQIDSPATKNSALTWYNDGTQYWTVKLVSATDLAWRVFDDVNGVYRLIINPGGTFEIDANFAVTATEIGFFGGTPVVQQVLAAYTPDVQSAGYVGINNAQVGTVYATNAALNALRAAYENLRIGFEDLRTKIIDTTLVDV